jgi:hypothetical protein
MPLGDRTGPLGMGPMTGRAAGYCAGFSVPGYMNPIPRRGFGWWRGAGYPYGAQYGYGVPYFGVGRGGFPRGGGRGRVWGGGRRGSWRGRGFGWRSAWVPPYGAYAPTAIPYAY